MLPDGLLDPRITSAVIGASALAIGWLAAARRERGTARRARIQRENDLRIALGAEIATHVQALRLFDLEEHWRRVVLRMEADPEFVPLVPTERSNAIFSALITEVQVLPRGAIEPVVRYYALLYAIEGMVGDLRSEQYRGLPQDRRIEMFGDYIALRQEALSLGETAMAALADPRPAGRRG